MASSLADTEHILFLDTRTLERRVMPLLEKAEILVTSGESKRIATHVLEQYNQAGYNGQILVPSLGLSDAA
ncbi:MULTISPECIES: hypothetical protein [Nostoc]|uniref:hypothetical protein n=1 Tax=Nostoc TaxID=1177 RepID=UPI001F557C2C|nr:MULTISPECIES: hypothetical protein [Nostoc]